MSDAQFLSVPVAPTKPNLPAYACDGRELRWNQSGTAVSFSSTNDEYHSDHDAVSSSMLKVLHRSPAHLRAYLVGPRKAKSSFVIGNAIHTAVLEPHLFARQYVVFAGSRLGNNTEWRSFKERHQHVGILSPRERDEVLGVARAVRNTVVIHNGARNFRMSDLIAHGSVEQNIYWVDAATGLTCRMRYDLMIQNIMVDLKSTTDAREWVFARDSMKFLYHVQIAHYIAGLNAYRPENASLHTPILLAAEKGAPFATVAHKLDWAGFIDVGQDRLKELMAQYRSCIDSNTWPAYEEPAETLKLPTWALYEHMSRPGPKTSRFVGR